jgi:hypothetical protein
MRIELKRRSLLSYGRLRGLLKKKRKLFETAMLVSVVLSAYSVFQFSRSAVAITASGRVIDLYTQKGGIGSNQSSDAFEPQELVVLYALVTYNGGPVAQKDVGFHVDGPPNALENITAIGENVTGQDGIAQFSFRIPWPNDDPETKVIGEWDAIATVGIADQTVVDTLTFQVGWIIRITDIATLNMLSQPQTQFLRNETVEFNLTIQNIALVEKLATITVDVQDALAHPIIHIEMENLTFQPGITYVLATSQIPNAAAIGQASILAAAYREPPENGGSLYSPAISATLDIISTPPVLHDIEVDYVKCSKNEVFQGETISIIVGIRNNGNLPESTNVSVYYDDVLIEKRSVKELPPKTEQIIMFDWDTTNVPSGTYHITARADPVEGETNLANNVYYDGSVQIKIPSPPSPKLPSGLLALAFLAFALVAGILAIFFLLFMLEYLRRRRKRKRPETHFTLIAHHGIH